MPKKSKTLVLGDRQHMLDTLHLAYKYVLDQATYSSSNLRLDAEKQRELGSRLAQYWSIKK